MNGEWELRGGALLLWLYYDKQNETSSGTSGCSVIAAIEPILGRDIEDVKRVCVKVAAKSYNMTCIKFKEA